MTAEPAAGATGVAGSAEAVEGQLRAGALLPAGSGAAAEPIGARIYRHPALGERRVVRLVPDAIGRAEDLALETLDFALERVHERVAVGRPRGLGFPATAILADPANAHYALDVVKEMERFGRMAKGKPGNAKDGFELIAARLAKSVPHYLPSFHEQAGRYFLDAGANAQAATQFAKAREAERTYGIPVDEAQRRQSFLEFALAGALTVSALTDYARDLAAGVDRAASHAALTELCLQRTLGGLPPWTAMATELRRSAKAAGLDPAGEEAGLLPLLLAAPATAKASAGFWKGYRPALLRLAKADPAFRGLMLNLHPAPNDGAAEFSEWWLELLEEAGALVALEDPDAPAAARPRGGTAAWVNRTVQQGATGYWWAAWKSVRERFARLIARLAPVLRAEGTPIDLAAHTRVNIDLLDAALGAGVPIAAVRTMDVGHTFDLKEYAQRKERLPLEGIGAAVTAAAAGSGEPNPILADLERAVAAAMTEAPDWLAEIPGLHELIRSWLRAQRARVDGGTLLPLADAVEDLRTGGTARVIALEPATAFAIADADVPAILARTLRDGLFAELAYPALERIGLRVDMADLGGHAWPALALRESGKLIVVGPQGVVLEHDLQIPRNAAAWSHARNVVANGQALVAWSWPDGKAYWTGRPGDLLETTETLFVAAGGTQRHGTSLELSDGSRCEGARPVHAGDRTIPPPLDVVSDGTGAWAVTNNGSLFWQLDQEPALRELDPASGKSGRASLPLFYEAFLEEGWKLNLGASWLMPLPAGASADAIGTAGGLVGFRVRGRSVSGRTEWEIEGVDGRRFRGFLGRPGTPALGDTPVALMTLPGDSAPRVVTRRDWSQMLTVWDADGRFPVMRAAIGSTGRTHADGTVNAKQTNKLLNGMPFVLPPAYWFAYSYRDAAGSAELRRVDERAARRLVDAVMADLPPKAPLAWDKVPAAAKVLDEVLPQVTDPNLRAAVLAAVVLAGRLRQRLDGVRETARIGAAAAKLAATEANAPEKRAAEKSFGDTSPVASAPVVPVHDDGALSRACSGLLVRTVSTWSANGGHRPLDQIAAISTVFAESPHTQERAKGGLLGFLRPRKDQPQAAPSIALPPADFGWFLLLGRLGAVALRAALASTSAEDRAALVALLRSLGDGGWADRAGNIRLLRLQNSTTPVGGRLEWTADHLTYFATHSWIDGHDVALAFQHARDGRFSLDGKIRVLDEERPGAGWATTERLTRFLSLLAERGPVPFDAGAAAVLAERTGLTRPAATLLLATLPNADSEEANFLAAPAREAMGLKLADAKVARAALATLKRSERLALLDAAMPADPAELWDRGLVPVAERLATAWIRRFGQSVRIDEETIARASSELRIPEQGVRLLVAPASNVLTKVPNPAEVVARYGGKEIEEAITTEAVTQAATLIAWTHATLPVGHVLASRLGDVVATLEKTLASPRLTLWGGYFSSPGLRKAAPALGGREVEVPGARSGMIGFEFGPVTVLTGGHADDYCVAIVRPALLGAEPPAFVWSLTPEIYTAVSCARYFARGFARRIAEHAAASPSPVGTFEADPAVSAPILVVDVAATLNLEPDAARLFLQLLALPAPTKAAVAQWNGWTAKDWKRAAEPLLANDLVVTGQRARAGRDLFVAGPWVDAPAPDLPLEQWKLPMFDASVDEARVLRRPFLRLLPILPLPDHFALAWKRWQDGDRPGFEQPVRRR